MGHFGIQYNFLWPAARPLLTQDNTNTQKAHTVNQTRFETKLLVFEGHKTAQDLTADPLSSVKIQIAISILTCEVVVFDTGIL